MVGDSNVVGVEALASTWWGLWRQVRFGRAKTDDVHSYANFAFDLEWADATPGARATKAGTWRDDHPSREKGWRWEDYQSFIGWLKATGAWEGDDGAERLIRDGGVIFWEVRRSSDGSKLELNIEVDLDDPDAPKPLWAQGATRIAHHSDGWALNLRDVRNVVQWILADRARGNCTGDVRSHGLKADAWAKNGILGPFSAPSVLYGIDAVTKALEMYGAAVTALEAAEDLAHEGRLSYQDAVRPHRKGWTPGSVVRWALGENPDEAGIAFAEAKSWLEREDKLGHTPLGFVLDEIAEWYRLAGIPLPAPEGSWLLFYFDPRAVAVGIYCRQREWYTEVCHPIIGVKMDQGVVVGMEEAERPLLSHLPLPLPENTMPLNLTPRDMLVKRAEVKAQLRAACQPPNALSDRTLDQLTGTWCLTEDELAILRGAAELRGMPLLEALSKARCLSVGAISGQVAQRTISVAEALVAFNWAMLVKIQESAIVAAAQVQTVKRTMSRWPKGLRWAISSAAVAAGGWFFIYRPWMGSWRAYVAPWRDAGLRPEWERFWTTPVLSTIGGIVLIVALVAAIRKFVIPVVVAVQGSLARLPEDNS